MRVGIINYTYPLYESGSYVLEGVNSLATAKGIDKIYLIAACYPGKNFYKPDNLTLLWVPLFRKPFVGDLLFNFFVLLKGLFSEFRQVDVINVYSARPVLAARLLGKLLRKPVIVSIEIINPSVGHAWDRLFNLYQKFAYTSKFDQIICWSNFYVKKYLEPWRINIDKVKIIPCGIDTKVYSPRIEGSSIRQLYPKCELFLVFAKPMYEYNRKMMDLLLEAVDLLRHEIDIQLLVGSGEQKHLVEDKAKQLRLDNKVHFMPFVAFTEIPKYIAASDFIVLPFTYHPTTSRSLFESMAMGKAIITTNMGEVPYLLKHEQHALIVQPNKDELAIAIKRLYHDKKLQAHLAQNATKLVAEHYSVEATAKKTVEVYSIITALARKAPKPCPEQMRGISLD